MPTPEWQQSRPSRGLSVHPRWLVMVFASPPHYQWKPHGKPGLPPHPIVMIQPPPAGVVVGDIVEIQDFHHCPVVMRRMKGKSRRSEIKGNLQNLLQADLA
jgi:hypothetical protein